MHNVLGEAAPGDTGSLRPSRSVRCSALLIRLYSLTDITSEV